MSSRDDRLFSASPRKGETRTPFQIDRDRILYSSAFRRLAHVTQVVSPDVGHVFHNRLTHSLQVAQVGRRIAERLCTLDGANEAFINADAVEAACLAHDLGHPPFGHVAEEELQELTHGSGFEGNPQSFRIVTKLAFRSTEHAGLNLTRATLNAVLKYPWRFGGNSKKKKKWGAYPTEEQDFKFARSNATDMKRSHEAEIMDWADDVTYSVHDLEDFFRAGMIPLHLLARFKGKEIESFFEGVFSRHADDEDGIWRENSRAALEDVFRNIVLLFEIQTQFDGSQQHRALLRSFTGKLIDRYVHGVSCTSRELSKNQEIVKEVAMLKELTWHYVINAPSMATYQEGQRRIIRELFNIYGEAGLETKRRKLFPPYFRQMLEKAHTQEDLIRAVVDLIAGLTEPQAIALHHQLTGQSLGFGLQQIV